MRDKVFSLPLRRGARLALALALAAALGGCAQFRGIPTHGGGKRFDEEERVVSGSIRRALADMDLKELRGKNVVIQLESIAHSGGGFITFPGIQGISGNYGVGENLALNRYLVTPPPNAYIPFGDSNNENSSKNYGAGANGTFSTNYNATTLATDPDLAYLRSSLTMKAQHCGLNVVGANPDCTLYVLVDVLGTNRSRDDSFVCWTDRLLASCELTYYAQDCKNGQLLFRARHASAESEYCEKSIIGFTAYKIDRTIASAPATPLPVDGDEVASSTAKLNEKIVNGVKVAKAPPHKARLCLGRFLARAEAKPAEPSLRQSLKKFLETQLANARMQLQAGNLNEAQRLLDSVRAVRPDFPGLNEVQSELMQRRQQPPPTPPK